LGDAQARYRATVTGTGGGAASPRATVGPWLLAALALCGLAVAAIGVVHTRADAQVRRTGRHTDAVLVSRQASARGPDHIRVAFATTHAQVVQARVAVGRARSFGDVAPVPLRYDVAHPTHVVLDSGEESRLERPLVFGLLVAVTAGASLAVQHRLAVDRPELRRTTGRGAAAVGGVAVAVLLVSGLLPVPSVRAPAHCVSPPQPAPGPGAVDLSTMGGALTADGLATSNGSAFDLASAATTAYAGDQRVALMLADAGFNGGWFVQEQTSDHPVQAFAVQLRDPRSARLFEAERLALVCANPHLVPYDVGVPAADGTWTAGRDGIPQTRVALLRGSRVYLLVERGTTEHYPADLRVAVSRLAAEAR
jgi:hypothetical protein